MIDYKERLIKKQRRRETKRQEIDTYSIIRRESAETETEDRETE